MIDSNKDRQEAAIYIFTTVTVIFLPLTFVAGVLGMNTNDIRNMTINQWVFWVTAIPFTVIVIGICLLFTGELSDIWLWLTTSRPSSKQVARQGVLLPEKAETIAAPNILTPPPPMGSHAHPQPHTIFSRRRRESPPRYAEHILASQPYDSHSLYQESFREPGSRMQHRRRGSLDDDDGTSTVHGSTYGTYGGPRRRGTEDWVYNV